MSSLFQEFHRQACRFPAAPAVVHANASPAITHYGELLALAEGYAEALARLAPEGAFVPIYVGKSAHSIALSLACLAAGRPFAWLNKRLRAPQLAEVMAAGNAVVAVADAAGFATLGGAISAAGLAHVRWLGLADGTRAGDERALAAAMSRLPEGVLAQPIEPHGGSARAGQPGTGDTAFGCCLFTSGSTGRQKGVMISAGDLTARARSEADWYSLGAGDRLLSVLPFAFDVGLNQLLSALVAGACLVIQESWLPKDLLRTLVDEHITGISGVPALWRDVLSNGMRLDSPEMRDSLRYITVSGGSLAPAEQTRLRATADSLAIFKTYGQTETFRSASLRPEAFDAQPASVGRAYPGTRVHVLREDGHPCAPGEVGEIVHSGLGTMLGYLGDPVRNEKLRPLPASLGGETAVYTGDYGYLDRDGYLFLKGRRDAMVKIGGNRVYPDEVADQLRALDGVREAEVVSAAAGTADPQLIGFVVADAAAHWTAAALRRAAGKVLPAHMVPANFVVLPAIPRLPNGKPDRVALAAAAT